MKRELDLTQEQIDAVRLIVEEDMVKREDLRQSVQNQAAITDRSIIQSKIRQLDEDEGQKLSQVLTKDQMNKWEQKQNLKNAFNQDQVDNDQWKPEDEGHGMGAAF